MEIINRRGSLIRTRNAVASGKLKIGLLGGSITASLNNNRRWGEILADNLMQSIPNVSITVSNASIGGTGSDYGVFRAEREIISKNCDLVFVESAVNDYDFDSKYRAKSREGLLRKLIKSGCDVVIVYTYFNKMHNDMMQGEIPASIMEYEELAEHYGISSIWVGKYAFDEVTSGIMRLDEWLPDGVHPQERGSYSYAQPVLEYVKSELDGKPESKSVLVTPLNDDNWEGCRVIPFDEIKWNKPWILRDGFHNNIRNEFLSTSAAVAKLKYEFIGTGTCITYMFGEISSEMFYRIDGGELMPFPNPRNPEKWMGQNDWHKFTVLAENLPFGKHLCEIEVRANPLGSLCCIEMIGELG